MTPSDVLSRAQAAARLGITTRTLDTYRKAGRIKGIEYPGRVKYRLGEIERFITDRTDGGR